jgi:hypothetical protein
MHHDGLPWYSTDVLEATFSAGQSFHVSSVYQLPSFIGAKLSPSGAGVGDGVGVGIEVGVGIGD